VLLDLLWPPAAAAPEVITPTAQGHGSIPTFRHWLARLGERLWSRPLGGLERPWSGSPGPGSRWRREAGETPTWPLPQLDEVEIVYSTTDRYVGESLEPDEEYAEDVRGVVNSVVLREEGDEVRGKGAGQARPQLST